MELKEMVMDEMRQIQEQQDSYIKNPRVARYLALTDEWMQENKGRSMTVQEKRMAAQLMRNAIIDTGAKMKRSLWEATTEDDIAFLGVQLPVIAALVPSLALSEIAITQALDRRVGALFYMNVLADTTKGYVSADDVMLSAKTGHARGKSARRFAMARVVDELIGTGNGAQTGTVDWPHLINLDNVKFEVVANIGTASETRTELGTSTSAGVVTGDYVSGNGSINSSGVYNVTFTGLDSSDTIYITYDYQYDLITDTYGSRTGVPRMKVSSTYENITAIDFPIRTEISLGAQIDMQKAHNINLETEMVKWLGNEIKMTIDQVGLDMIHDAAGSDDAATAVTTWNATKQSGQEWLWKKYEFVDRILEGNQNIINKALRGNASYIVCGLNVGRVIQQLTDYFKPVAGLGKAQQSGPMKIGELSGRTVIQNPFMPTNYYDLGYKGDSILYAGFALLPYIPLMATPTLVTNDLVSQKGFLSSAGFKVINPGLFCQGQISNLSGQTTG